MNISVISTHKEFLELEEDWKNIFDQSGTKNIFVSWEWCSLWWKHYGRNQELLILAVKDEDEIIGIAPLMVSKGDPLTLWKPKVNFLGGNLADYIDFLILRNNKEVIKTIIYYLINLADWGVIDFKRIPEYSPNLIPIKECIFSLYYRSVIKISSISPVVKIQGSWDDYYRSLNKGLRQDIRTAYNKFKLLGEVSYEDYTENPGKALLDVFFGMHKKRQTCKLGQSPFEAQTTRDFFYDLAAIFTKLRWADISALKINERIFSVVFALRYKEIFYYWIPVFDPESSKYSPGKIHIHALLKRAFDQQFKEFDLMRGDEAYKYKWSNKTFNSYELKIFKNNLCCKLDLLRSASKNYLKELYNKYPLFKKMLVKISKVIPL